MIYKTKPSETCMHIHTLRYGKHYHFFYDWKYNTDEFRNLISNFFNFNFGNFSIWISDGISELDGIRLLGTHKTGNQCDIFFRIEDADYFIYKMQTNHKWDIGPNIELPSPIQLLDFLNKETNI